MIQAQASAHLMNTDNFEASAGWLFCFWEWYDISWKVEWGEEIAADAYCDILGLDGVFIVT
jgi:hypothetical protein